MIELELTKEETEVLRNCLDRIGFAGMSGSVITMMHIETKLKDALIAEGNKEKKEGKRFQFDKCSKV